MALTRRSLFAAVGATAAAGATAAGAAARPTRRRQAAAALTQSDLVASYGVCVHPNWAKDPMYSQTDRWMAKLAELGAKQIRGLVVPNQKQCKRTAELCRQYGIKWLMTVSPPTWALGPAETTARINQVADQFPDVVLGFEGVNEPNNTGTSNWAQRTFDIQRAIWDARNSRQELAHAAVLSPSMHAVREDQSGGAGYRAIAKLGIADYCDVAALHSYPRGSEITTGLDKRLGLLDLAYPGKQVWITEAGWTTYTGSSGHRRTTEPDAAEYGSAAISTMAEHPRVQKWFRYELLDDPGNGSDSESRFGLVRADWSNKPEFSAVQQILR